MHYEDFLLQEFFPFIEKRYRIAPGRSHRAIDGISMGGYGALHLAFRHPQLSVSAAAHSAALIEKLPEFVAAHPMRPSGSATVLSRRPASQTCAACKSISTAAVKMTTDSRPAPLPWIRF
jgi:S-formylglutathione hydrolase FrmB